MNNNCSTCKFLLPVHCYPGNDDIGKGSMNQQLGYVCLLFKDDCNKGIFFERDTGLCECHTEKRINDMEILTEEITLKLTNLYEELSDSRYHSNLIAFTISRIAHNLAKCNYEQLDHIDDLIVEVINN